MKTNKLTPQEKKSIRESAAMIYAASECDEIYNKEDFLNKLRKMVYSTPMVGGYAKASKILDSFKS